MNSSRSMGFIGAGNMSTALIKGITDSGTFSPSLINIYDIDNAKIRNITGQYGIKSTVSNRELVQNSNIIMLAVKPQVMNDVLEEIKEDITDSHIIISIAAGVTIKRIQGYLGSSIPVIRVMPNTPALIQKGMSAISFCGNCDNGIRELAEQILKSVGKTIFVEEKMMDAVTALSGSGPGFLFRIMEMFVKSAEEQGFTKEDSVNIVTQTFLGASALADESDLSLAQLREMVTSPGGTTEAGLIFLENSGISDVISGTIEAARKKSLELGKK